MGMLDGRTALVTGASRGLGVAIARRLAGEGAAVAISARTVNPGEGAFEGSLAETLDVITGAGGRVTAIAADLSRPDDRERLVAETEGAFGPIDILVNNAAVTWFEPVDAFNMRHYELMFEVQVRAPFELSRLVLPGMRAKGAGWICNISSGAARHPQGPPFNRRMLGGTVYGMCKAALERFTTGLAAEVYDDGIAVNVVSPAGLVATPGVIHHRLPRPGVTMEAPAVMAEAVLALCSGDPAALTGRVLYSRPLLEELGVPIPEDEEVAG